MALPHYAPADNDLTRPFWDGVRVGEIRMPRCSQCGEVQWYPLGVSEHDDGGFFEWQPVAAAGTVFAQTTVRRPFLPGATKQDVPYTVLIIELDDVPNARFVSRLRDSDRVTVGQRVRAEFGERDGRPDLQFVPA
jgi:uncharacterized OB-fold protein